MAKIDDTLDQRGTEYGTFKDQAEVQQILKNAFRAALALKDTDLNHFSTSQLAAIDMIIVKFARMINGNPNNIDSWHDIAGYAELIAKELSGESI